MTSDQNPGYLLYTGDEILPSYVGVLVRHYKGGPYVSICMFIMYTLAAAPSQYARDHQDDMNLFFALESDQCGTRQTSYE